MGRYNRQAYATCQTEEHEKSLAKQGANVGRLHRTWGQKTYQCYQFFNTFRTEIWVKSMWRYTKIESVSLDIRLIQLASYQVAACARNWNTRAQQNVGNGFYQTRSDLMASPIALVPKKDGTLWLCINYCMLNVIIIQVSYPVPLMDEWMESLGNATVAMVTQFHSVVRRGQKATWFWERRMDKWISQDALIKNQEGEIRTPGLRIDGPRIRQGDSSKEQEGEIRYPIFGRDDPWIKPSALSKGQEDEMQPPYRGVLNCGHSFTTISVDNIQWTDWDLSLFCTQVWHHGRKMTKWRVFQERWKWYTLWLPSIFLTGYGLSSTLIFNSFTPLLSISFLCCALQFRIKRNIYL